MTLVVRAAVVDDAMGIAVVHVASWRAGYAGLLPLQYLDGLSVEGRAQRWSSLLAESSAAGSTLVAELDGVVIGFASVGPCRDDDADPGTGELWAIYVDPGRWGTGAGHALHVRAVQALRDTGARGATLWVLQGNHRAMRFYRRHGWVADGTTKIDWRDDVRLDEERYRITL